MDECRAYAKGRSLKVIGEYLDCGVSGKDANRPGLNRRMAMWRIIAERMIDRGLSTLAMARELNVAGMPKRIGGAWTAGSLRQLVQSAHALDGNWAYRRDGRRGLKRPTDRRYR